MKNLIIVLLLIGCIYLFFFYKAPQNIVQNVSTPPEVEEFVSAEVDKINSEIDKKGFNHAVFEAVQNNISDIQKVRDSAKKELDSALNLRDIEKKKVQHYLNQSIVWRDSFLLAKQTSDTSFRFKDKFASIEFVKPTQKDPYFNFSYDASVNYLEYWDKSWFLGKKKQYIDLWVEDTRATINGVKRIKIQPKPDNFKLDVSAAGIYTDRVNIGIDGNITLGRTKLGAGYYYDFIDNSWKPIFSAKYKLLEF